jgi:hypothetical protein
MSAAQKRILIMGVMTGVVVASALVAAFIYVLYTGPRMRVQQHVEAYSAVMPLLDTSAVAFAGAVETDGAVETLPIRVAVTSENLERGRVYYGYYCVFCHGQSGAGDGPVGQSYVPAPADLRTRAVAQMAQAELERAMVLGVGHEPVLARVVPASDRSYLALYIKHLAESPASQGSARGKSADH